MVSFKTKSGETVKFKTKKKTGGKSGMSAANRRKASRAAKKRPRYKTGKRKGQFKPT